MSVSGPFVAVQLTVRARLPIVSLGEDLASFRRFLLGFLPDSLLGYCAVPRIPAWLAS